MNSKKFLLCTQTHYRIQVWHNAKVIRMDHIAMAVKLMDCSNPL